MKKSDILFNSIPRCGNTFLAFAFTEAIRQNFRGGEDAFYEERNLYTHSHWTFLLRLNPDQTNVTQFTIFRDPLEQIPSLFALPHLSNTWKSPGIKNSEFLDGKILDAMNQYETWADNQITYNYSNIILFEDIKNDINKVLSSIFNKIEIEFKKEIDIEKVKSDLKKYEEEIYSDPKERFNMGRLPRGFDKTDQYKKIQELLSDPNWPYYLKYQRSVNYYNQIYKKARAN